MDFSKEHWVRLYNAESMGHRAKPLLARGLRDYLLRHGRKYSGVLVEDARSGAHAIEILLNAIGPHQDERELARKYIELWIKDGYLTLRQQKRRYALTITRFREGQTAQTPAARRQKRYREKRTAKAQQKQQDGPSVAPVTGNVTRSITRDVTRNVTRASLKKERKIDRDPTDLFARASEGFADRARRALEDPKGAHDIHTWAPVVEVIGACDRVWKSRTLIRTPTDPRVTTVLERLAEGFEPSELIAAIEGSHHDTYIHRNPHFQTVSTLLKSAEAVDKRAKLLSNPPPSGQTEKGGTVAVQPSDPAYYEQGGFEDKPPGPPQAPEQVPERSDA